jgi:hypothetical protein
MKKLTKAFLIDFIKKLPDYTGEDIEPTEFVNICMELEEKGLIVFCLYDLLEGDCYWIEARTTIELYDKTFHTIIVWSGESNSQNIDDIADDILLINNHATDLQTKFKNLCDKTT